jgi:hypothetical protein
VLEDTFGTEHASIILAVELDFLGGMDFTKSNGRYRLILILVVIVVSSLCDSHGQGSEDLVINRQVLGQGVVGDLVVWTLYSLVLEQLLDTFETETMSTRQ